MATLEADTTAILQRMKLGQKACAPSPLPEVTQLPKIWTWTVWPHSLTALYHCLTFENWAVNFVVWTYSYCSSINQTGSFENILPGLFHQKKASLPSPHGTKNLPPNAPRCYVNNSIWFTGSNATLPESVALGGRMMWTGQTLHPDTPRAAVKPHRGTGSLSQGRWEWVQMATAISCRAK